MPPPTLIVALIIVVSVTALVAYNHPGQVNHELTVPAGPTSVQLPQSPSIAWISSSSVSWSGATPYTIVEVYGCAGKSCSNGSGQIESFGSGSSGAISLYQFSYHSFRVQCNNTPDPVTLHYIVNGTSWYQFEVIGVGSFVTSILLVVVTRIG